MPTETALGPVQGYVASRSATGTKSDVPIIETPQSISVVPRAQIEAQNVQSVPEALRYTPGIVPEQRGINTTSLEYLYVRGFQIDQYLNGLRLPNVDAGFNILAVDPYFLERIELLRGPASVLYGQSAPGGLLNLVSKRPTSEPFREVIFQAGNFGRVKGAFDFSGPLDASKQFLYRLTGIGFHTDQQVDHYQQQRFAIAPTFQWRPTADTSLTVFLMYQNDPKAGFYNLMPAQGMVKPNPVMIPRNFDPGDPSFNKYRKENYSLGYAFEHRFNDVFSVNQNVRYLHNKSYIQGVFADDGVSCGGLCLNRYSFFNDGHFSNVAVDNQLHAKFATGPLQHKVTLGVDHQDSSEAHVFMANFGAPPISIVNPIYGQNIPFPNFLFGTSGTADQKQTGIYAQNIIKVDRWSFLVGGRRDFADGTFHSFKFLDTSHQSDSANSWRAGAVYLFDNGLAPYASYSTSFQPTIGSDFSGSLFKPTTGQQFEIGVKYQPHGVNAFITLAAFDITKQNVLTADPDHSFESIQLGEVRSRGFEMEARASLADFDLVAAYTYNQVRNTKDTQFLDKWPVGIPAHLAALWGLYKVQYVPLRGLEIGAGVRYVGRSFGDARNTFTVPSYTLFDAAVHYDLGYLRPDLKGWRASVTASNIFDKVYVSQCLGDNDCSFGLARRVLASLRYRW